MLIDLAIDLSLSPREAISRKDVFYALYIILADQKNLEWPAELWDIEINFEEAKEILKGFDFAILNQTMEIDEDFFPIGLFPEKRIRLKSRNTIWVIHNNDQDPFPSNPHAHCLEWNYKLHLGTGQCFHKRKLVYSVTRKELEKIRELTALRFKGELPPLEFSFSKE